MKKLFYIILAAMLISSPVVVMAYQITVGTNRFEFVFEQTNLTESEKSRIAADIAMCRHSWTNSAFVSALSDSRIGYIYDVNVVQSPYFNPGIKFPNWIVNNSTNVPSLLVRQDVCEAYTDSFGFINAHSNIIMQAYAFVDRISNSNLVCKTMSELVDYVLIQTNATVSLPAFFNGLREPDYSYPSVLSFGYYEKGPQNGGSATNLFMVMPSKYEDTIDTVPVIWNDGKWKFYMWDF